MIASFPQQNVQPLLVALRLLALRFYRRKLLISFSKHIRSIYGPSYQLYIDGDRLTEKGGNGFLTDLGKSIVAGADVFQKAAQTTWFEWAGGSTLIF